MTTLHIKRDELKQEYELISQSNQSILELASSADRSSGIDPVVAIQAIRLIAKQQLTCSPFFDELFYPE